MCLYIQHKLSVPIFPCILLKEIRCKNHDGEEGLSRSSACMVNRVCKFTFVPSFFISSISDSVKTALSSNLERSKSAPTECKSKSFNDKWGYFNAILVQT